VDADVVRMLAFQRGDERAFDELYAAWRDRVHRFAHRMLGGRALAEEVAQETFVRLYAARRRYRPTSRFAAYVLRIAANLCTNERRRASFHREVRDDAADPQAPPEQGPAGAVEGNELAAAVERALGALPERQRAAVVLARYEGCTMAELAAVLDTSEGAAKVLLHRARERLKVALGPWLEAPGRGEGP
jgi:RNA polymerase sigma-70 factor (ECF subfamily)